MKTFQGLHVGHGGFSGDWTLVTGKVRFCCRELERQTSEAKAPMHFNRLTATAEELGVWQGLKPIFCSIAYGPAEAVPLLQNNSMWSCSAAD
jgi:hypothetical protein